MTQFDVDPTEAMFSPKGEQKRSEPNREEGMNLSDRHFRHRSSGHELHTTAMLRFGKFPELVSGEETLARNGARAHAVMISAAGRH